MLKVFSYFIEPAVKDLMVEQNIDSIKLRGGWFDYMTTRIKDNSMVIKEEIDSLLSLASKVSYIDNHPIFYIQPCKSLIGIDYKKPPTQLLKWLENYIKKSNYNVGLEYNKMVDENLEVLSIQKLQESVVNNSLSDSHRYLSNLIKVSNPYYIMEAIFEISLSLTADKIIFCWFAYKCIRFMSSDSSVEMLYICIDCLNNNKINKVISPKYESFYLFCYMKQIIKSDMVRYNTIRPLLDKVLVSIDDFDILEINIPNRLKESLRKNGVYAIIDYIRTLKVNAFSIKELLMLDALRVLIQYDDKSELIKKII